MAAADQERQREELVLLLAPVGRDGVLAAGVLEQAGLQALVCTSVNELTAQLALGAGAAVASEEALTDEAVGAVAQALDAQPPWSDFPLVVLTARQTPDRANRRSFERLARLGNVTAIERPIHPLTLVSAVRAALRGRRRQYEGRTALREREREVRQRDQFLAMLGHELRNPLAAIMNATQLLERVTGDNSGAARPVSIIVRQTRHLTKLVDDLLDVARVTSGKIALKRETVDVRATISSVLEPLSRGTRDRRLDVELDVGPDPVCVSGDPVRLEQIFGNVITNAFKYTPSGGRIEVRVRRHDDQAVVTVTDTGVGISGDVLPVIFEAFTQAERTLDRSQGGMGLGLNVVRSLVELHGGTVAAASGGLGRGSTFTVSLPLAQAPVAVASDSMRNDAEPASARHILIVEDAADIRETLQQLLQIRGHRVDVAVDGLQGIERANSLRPDVVLVDIGLPVVDGYEVARRLRRSLGPGVLLVAVTGYGQPEDRAHALDAGFDEHLTKPVALNALDGLLERPPEAVCARG